MNLKSIVNKMFKAGLKADDWMITKVGRNFAVTLKCKLSIDEKAQMTQQQVDFHRKYEELEIEEMAKLFNEVPGTFGIFINV